MRYLANALSLGMLDQLHSPSGACFAIRPEISGTRKDLAIDWAHRHTWTSIVGHTDTALLLSEILGMSVEMRRVSTSLKSGDEVLVAQYNGPRLPEGAKSLPEGARIRWYFFRMPYPDNDPPNIDLDTCYNCGKECEDHREIDGCCGYCGAI